MTEGEPTARSGAQAVERAVRVLQCFENAADLGVREIATLVGLSTPTTFRLLRALKEGGLIAQDPQTERYHLGLQTAVLGRLAVERLGFARALPELFDLRDRTGESVNLGVLHGMEVVILAQAPTIHPLRFDQGPGTRNPAHVCAMGKALLAFEPEETVQPEFLVRHTDNTLTRRDDLLAQCVAIRRDGFAFNDEERTPGMRAVAAPILGADGRPIAAVAVQAPTVRFTIDRLDELAAEVLRTARRITGLHQLGAGALSS